MGRYLKITLNQIIYSLFLVVLKLKNIFLLIQFFLYI